MADVIAVVLEAVTLMGAGWISRELYEYLREERRESCREN